MPCACSSAAHQGHRPARSLDQGGSVGVGDRGGHRTAVGGQPHRHRAPAVTHVMALSSRRLAGFLPGDLFAWLGADIPGGGHIPFIAAYLGCQAGLGGGLRLSRAPVAQGPACWSEAAGGICRDLQEAPAVCGLTALRRRDPLGGGRSSGGGGQAPRVWGRGSFPWGLLTPPEEGGVAPRSCADAFPDPAEFSPAPRPRQPPSLFEALRGSS